MHSRVKTTSVVMMPDVVIRDKVPGGCVARRKWCILSTKRVHHGAPKLCRLRVDVKYLGRLSKGVARRERSLGARAAQDAKCQIT